MKKGQEKTFKYNDYEKGKISLTGVFLGKGQFATCYNVNGVVYSFVNTSKKENDYSKEAIVEWANSDNPHIPDFKRVGKYNNGDVFTSPLYNSLTKESVKAWQQYKIIKKVYESSFGLYQNQRDNLYNNRVLIDRMLEFELSQDIANALHSINDACANYGNFYRLEFPKRNLKVDNKGNLILLDVIFNQKA